jgi:predicted RNase H-like nuclease (RuvC/YqgF family)
MSPAEWATILAAIFGGGALYKTLESIALTLINKGKTVRDELREEIARLERKIDDQDDEIRQLKLEIAAKITAIDEWREKYYRLQRHTQSMEVSVEAKDYTIRVLEERITRLRRAVNCEYADNCPLLREARPAQEDELDN